MAFQLHSKEIHAEKFHKIFVEDKSYKIFVEDKSYNVVFPFGTESVLIVLHSGPLFSCLMIFASAT